jgi:SCY1-like protein 2
LLIRSVIKTLGSRVEEEHAQHLRDVRRIEQQTSTYDRTLENGSAFDTNGMGGGEMNFEDLVKGTSSPKPPAASSVGGMPWDEGWLDSNGGADALVSILQLDMANKLTNSQIHLYPHQ